MARIRLELLGCADVIGENGDRQALPSRNARAMLALLAVARGRMQTRTRISALLWDVVDSEHARGSLRQTLFMLRRSLGNGVFIQQGEAIALDPRAVDCDLWEFEDLVARGSPDALGRAGDLYRGEFLEGHPSGKGFAFDEWLAAERQRLRAEALQALARVLDQAIGRDSRDEVKRTANRMLAIDAAEEAAHRALMQVHARERRYGLALRQYEWCRKVLQLELGVEPDDETRRLHAEIVRSRTVSVTGGAGPAQAAQAAPVRAIGRPIGLRLAGAGA
jgi:DNA-binding SARP family transcriptional activator